MSVVAVDPARSDAGQAVQQRVEFERFLTRLDPGTVQAYVEIQQDVDGDAGTGRRRRQRLGRTAVVHHGAEGRPGKTAGEIDQPSDVGADHLVGDEDVLHARFSQHLRLEYRGALELGNPGLALHPDDGPHLVRLHVGAKAFGATGDRQGPIYVLPEPFAVDQHGRAGYFIDVGYEISGVHDVRSLLQICPIAATRSQGRRVRGSRGARVPLRFVSPAGCSLSRIRLYL